MCVMSGRGSVTCSSQAWPDARTLSLGGYSAGALDWEDPGVASGLNSVGIIMFWECLPKIFSPETRLPGKCQRKKKKRPSLKFLLKQCPVHPMGEGGC